MTGTGASVSWPDAGGGATVAAGQGSKGRGPHVARRRGRRVSFQGVPRYPRSERRARGGAGRGGRGQPDERGPGSPVPGVGSTLAHIALAQPPPEEPASAKRRDAQAGADDGAGERSPTKETTPADIAPVPSVERRAPSASANTLAHIALEQPPPEEPASAKRRALDSAAAKSAKRRR